MAELRKPPMKHNPGFLPADELIDAFIVRQAELESLLETLRGNTAESNQHVLVIGRRGMGKTMLVHRLALAIERDTQLASTWYPILFGEEAYNVSSAAELWLEALHQLARQTEDKRWNDAHVTLRREFDNRRLHDQALARLLDFADERKVRLMVAVENLQDILGEQMPDEEAWVLRHTLLNEPRIMLLATATARFDDIEKPKKAAYELFGTLHLRPLDGAEIRTIWARLTGEVLDGQAHRVIEIFTGGNPRLLAVLASFSHGRKLRDFMAELLGLIDDHSDYFKSNLEALPIDERRAFVAMCELWEPSPARAIAEVARFGVNKASMLLGRLVTRGAAEIVQTKGRANYYQTCERLYSFFYRLRRNTTRSNRAASVAEFITRFYLPERLPELAIRLAAEACHEVADIREEQLLVLHRLFERGNIPSATALEQFPQEFWAMEEVQRPDLPWRDSWEAQRVQQLGRWTHGIQRRMETWDETDIDAPLLQTCKQLFEHTISAEACRAVVAAADRRASRASIALLIMFYCLNFDLHAIEQLALELSEHMKMSPAEVDFAIGAGTRGRWRDPEIRSLCEMKLLRIIALPNQEVAMSAAQLLFEMYQMSGNTDAAIQICERALTICSTADFHCNLGKSLVDRDPGRAEAELRLALEVSPYHPETGLSFVGILLSQDRVAEADAFARDWRASRPYDVAGVTALCQVWAKSDAELEQIEEFFAGVSPGSYLNRPVKQWLLPGFFACSFLETSKVRTIAKKLRDEVMQRTGLYGSATIDAVAETLAYSCNREFVLMSVECEAQLADVRAKPRHVVQAVTLGNHDRALEVLRELARDNPEELGRLLGAYRTALLQLAIARPVDLHTIASTIPLFEPLAFALAQELGHDVLAPHEVTEVAKDIRAEMQQLRGSTPYAVPEVPMLAAADAPRRARSKQQAKKTPRKPSKRRL